MLLQLAIKFKLRTRGSALSDEQIKSPLIFEQVHRFRKVRLLQADAVAVQHLVARLDPRLCGQSSWPCRLDKDAGPGIWAPTDGAPESLVPVIQRWPAGVRGVPIFSSKKVPILFEDNSYLFVISLAKLMHRLLSAKFGNLIPKIFFVVIGNLESDKKNLDYNILNLKSKIKILCKFVIFA